MSVLVDDLLLLARLDQGRPLERVTGRPRRAWSPTPSRRPGPSTTSRPISFDVRRPGASWSGDAARLRQVVDNLLQQRRWSTRRRARRSTCAVRARRVAAPWCTVADEGPGLERRAGGARLRPLLPGQRGPHRVGQRARAVDRGRAGRRPRRAAPSVESTPGAGCDVRGRAAPRHLGTRRGTPVGGRRPRPPMRRRRRSGHRRRRRTGARPAGRRASEPDDGRARPTCSVADRGAGPARPLRPRPARPGRRLARPSPGSWPPTTGSCSRTVPATAGSGPEPASMEDNAALLADLLVRARRRRRPRWSPTATAAASPCCWRPAVPSWWPASSWSAASAGPTASARSTGSWPCPGWAR